MINPDYISHTFKVLSMLPLMMNSFEKQTVYTPLSWPVKVLIFVPNSKSQTLIDLSELPLMINLE
jgi:hypothetical protein